MASPLPFPVSKLLFCHTAFLLLWSIFHVHRRGKSKTNTKWKWSWKKECLLSAAVGLLVGKYERKKMALFIFLSIYQPYSQLVPRSKYLFSLLNTLYLSYAGFENLVTNQDIIRYRLYSHHALLFSAMERYCKDNRTLTSPQGFWLCNCMNEKSFWSLNIILFSFVACSSISLSDWPRDSASK